MSDDRVPERGSRAALAGVAFAGFFVGGWLCLRNVPSLDDPTDDLIAYYGDPDNRRGAVVAGLYLMPFAAIAFMWFVAALRARFVGSTAREHTLLATVHLLAGALFIASLFTLSAIHIALVWLAESSDSADLDVESMRALLALARATADIIALRAGAVFIAITSTRAVRMGLFPRSYGVASTLLAIVMLVAFRSVPAVSLLMPLWVLLTTAFVLRRTMTRDLDGGA